MLLKVGVYGARPATQVIISHDRMSIARHKKIQRRLTLLKLNPTLVVLTTTSVKSTIHFSPLALFPTPLLSPPFSPSLLLSFSLLIYLTPEPLFVFTVHLSLE